MQRTPRARVAGMSPGDAVISTHCPEEAPSALTALSAWSPPARWPGGYVPAAKTWRICSDRPYLASQSSTAATEQRLTITGVRSAGGATWLQVSTLAIVGRPVVTQSPGPVWGYHRVDINLAL